MRLSVDAAAEIVDAEGARAVTARRIAQRIGYAPGTLYTHFRNLDEILVYVNAVTLKDLRLRCGAAVAAADSGVAALLALSNAYLEYALAHPHRVEMLFKASFVLPPDSPPDSVQDSPPDRPTQVGVDDVVQQNVAQLITLIENQLRLVEPEAEEKTVNLRAKALWSGIHGVCALSHQAFPRQSSRAILDTLVKVFRP
jgi:AcrR family transcriptional regulator